AGFIDTAYCVQSLLHGEEHVGCQRLSRLQFACPSRGLHGSKSQRISGARLEHCHVVVEPAAVAGEEPAGRKDRGVEAKPAGQTLRRVCHRAPSVFHFGSIEKVELALTRMRYAAQIYAAPWQKSVGPGELPGRLGQRAGKIRLPD